MWKIPKGFTYGLLFNEWKDMKTELQPMEHLKDKVRCALGYFDKEIARTEPNTKEYKELVEERSKIRGLYLEVRDAIQKLEKEQK